MADLCAVTEIATPDPAGFWNRGTGWRFGASLLARGESVGQTFERDADRIRRSGLDHVHVVVNFSDGVGDFNDRAARMGSGSVQFRDLSKPFRSRTTQVDILNLICPRDIVPGWLLNRPFHGLTLSPDTAGARLIASHLSTLALVADQITEDQGIAAVDATFVIAERFMGGDVRPTIDQTEAIHRTVRRRAIQVFESSLSRGVALDPAQIASAVGVSRSSLYRAFADTGGVQAYIRNRRLDRLYAALRSGEADARSLPDIVQRSGFASMAAFRREFSDRFGFAPGDLSAASPKRRIKPARHGRIEVDFTAHDVLIDWVRVGEPS